MSERPCDGRYKFCVDLRPGSNPSDASAGLIRVGGEVGARTRIAFKHEPFGEKSMSVNYYCSGEDTCLLEGLRARGGGDIPPCKRLVKRRKSEDQR